MPPDAFCHSRFTVFGVSCISCCVLFFVLSPFNSCFIEMKNTILISSEKCMPLSRYHIENFMFQKKKSHYTHEVECSTDSPLVTIIIAFYCTPKIVFIDHSDVAGTARRCFRFCFHFDKFDQSNSLLNSASLRFLNNMNDVIWISMCSITSICVCLCV